MKIFNYEETHALLSFPPLIEGLKEAFQGGIQAPKRHHHTMETEKTEEPSTLLLMPAWKKNEGVGIKIVTVTPGNMARGLPSVGGHYIFLDGITKVPLALFDGGALTLMRTSATSALASRYLSRVNSKTFLMVGTGALAPHLIKAHASQRPLENIMIWGRNYKKAQILASSLEVEGANIKAIKNLESACAQTDIISTATLSSKPLIFGDWVKEGTHIDLVGAYRPDMRESDNALIQKSSVFVDTFLGALSEAGDIIQPLETGLINHESIKGEIKDLVSGGHKGRDTDKEITLFKSVGASLEDYTAASLAWDNSNLI